MTFFAKARSASSCAIAVLLALGMVPAAAFAADGAAATTQDATASDDAAAVLVESGDTASAGVSTMASPLPFQRRSLLPAKMRKMSRETMVLGAKTRVFRSMLIRSFPVRALRYRATFVGPSALRASASM